MKKIIVGLSIMAGMATVGAQTFSPENLWQIGRVKGVGIAKDKKTLVYKVGSPDIGENKIINTYYQMPVSGGSPVEIKEADAKAIVGDDRISPDGKYILSAADVKLQKVLGKDRFGDLPQTSGSVFESLNYRHWDTWFDGNFSHIFLAPEADANKKKDLLEGKPYFCPQQPFGGDEDYIFSPDSKQVVYVTKPAFGTDYAISTNTDIFVHDIASGKTQNLTEANKGYDLSPAFSSQGKLAWLHMKTPGYEADKQDLVVLTNGIPVNLTAHNDKVHVESFQWSEDGKSLFFIAPIDGTLQLFTVKDIGLTKMLPPILQLTHGDFDVSGIVAQNGNELIVARESIDHASELYAVQLDTHEMKQLTHVNDTLLQRFGNVKVEKRFVKTSDGQRMLEWVVFPPAFDKTKKYPTLLYCQGGPQSATTQFFSYRWNFKLIASQGYIVVVPSRRGMPGFGTKWNEAVSKDWGGQVIQDYLDATDDISKEPYVDTARRAAVGASFGGFSVFALAGKHQKRFKTFIAHDGVFDFRSMYGTTDEMWFENWEKGGPYWDKNNAVVQRSFGQSPSNDVDRWDTPIMIVQGGKDYRVPIEQGQQAFQAAQLKGIKSKLLYFPDENHWVLKPQNALLWQREFFGWLKETL